MKHVFVIFSLLIVILLSACSKNSNAVQKPNFETQLIELDNSKFEIPKDWQQLDVPSSIKQNIYAPKGADLSLGTSNVGFIITKASTGATSISDLKNNSSSFEEQIKAIFPEATDFKVNSFKSPAGDVFTVSYQVPYGNTILKQTQYYVLIDHYVVIITATDIGDKVSPDVNDVAKHIINSLKLTKQ